MPASLISVFLITLALLSIETPAWSRAPHVGPPPQAISVHEIWKKSAGPLSGDVFLLPKRGNFFLDESDFENDELIASTIQGKKIPPHPITNHGYAWDYDLRIPIVFCDPTQRWFKAGIYKTLAVQQDIAPTLAHILDVPTPARNGGRVLFEALTKEASAKLGKTKPRAILVFVQDQAGKIYYDSHPGKAPFYEFLMSKGANFVNGTVAHVDVETSVGHAAIGTGAWPPETGIAGNNFFHTGIWRTIKAMTMPTSTDKKENIVGHGGLFLTPTLSDVWMTATQGKAKILSQAYAVRAAMGMGGHGSLFETGYKTNVVWTDETDPHAEFYQTNEKSYSLAAAYRGASVRPYVESLLGVSDPTGKRMWRDHPLIDKEGRIETSFVRGSPAGPAWESDLAIAAIKELQIGQDDVTDFVYINMKATDACGHMYGVESEECGEVLAAADHGAQKIFEAIREATSGNLLVVLTADHGAAPLPEISGAVRFNRQQLIKDINHQFDHRDNHIDVVMSLASSELYLNRGELADNGYKIEDVVKYLKSYKVPFKAPYNVLADEWIKKGKAKEQLFFEEVVPKENLK